MTPIVGISCYVTEATWGPRTEWAALLPHTYVRLLHGVGAAPLLLPEGPPEGAAGVAARLDALVLAGGGDVDPERYGAARHPATNGVSGPRDAWEFALLNATLDGDLPVLAVCRGAQVLNVARGGDLVQHLPDVVGHEGHLADPVNYGAQRIEFAERSHIGAALGGAASVRCHHHQGFGRLGEGLRAVAWAQDGIPEGIELAGHHFAVGAQWHPERSGHDRLFAALAAAARSGGPHGTPRLSRS